MLLVSLSPLLPITPTPHHLHSPSPHLLPSFQSKKINHHAKTMQPETLERIFLNSPSWTEPPAFSVGDRVFVRPLNIRSVIKGVLSLDNTWRYYIKHNGSIKQMQEYQLVTFNSYLNLRPKYKIGDIVTVEGCGEKLIYGQILDSGWKYFIYTNFNVLISIEESQII